MSSDPLVHGPPGGDGSAGVECFSQFAILEVKQAIRNMTVAQAEEIAARAEMFDVARDLESFLRGELPKLCPELVN